MGNGRRIGKSKYCFLYKFKSSFECFRCVVCVEDNIFIVKMIIVLILMFFSFYIDFSFFVRVVYLFVLFG